MNDSANSSWQMPSFSHALVCFSGVMIILAIGFQVLHINSHSLLFLCVLWVCCNAAVLDADFVAIKGAMTSGLERGLSIIYIFILIGVLIAAFIESGTIASIVYYAFDLVHPMIFLPAGLLLCSFMSLATGTSWGTVGTVGLILLGIGSALQIPLPLIAGMVISGAIFGDKMSPVSDTTNLAATCAGADLYGHIRAMLYTTLPSYVICLLLFTWLGLEYGQGQVSAAEINQFKTGLSQIFAISPWTFIPLVVLLALSFRGVAPEPCMVASIVVAAVLAMVLQDRAFTDVMDSLQGGYVISTGQANIDALLNKGGIQSMMWTLSLSLLAFALGGLMHTFDFLTVLLRGLLNRIQAAATLMTTTIAACFVGNMTLGDSYLSIIMGCQVFKEKYQQQGLQSRLLSRCVEEGGTLTTSLVPWSPSAAFYFSILGVTAWEYAPFVLLALVNPVVSIVLAYLGFGILRRSANEVVSD